MTVVRTRYGLLDGRPGPTGVAFLGVPYAAPPIGARRFQPPAPAQPWRGTRAATSFAPSAPQPGSVRAQLVLGPSAPSAEDCLYLNVWTPSVAVATARPVLVWLHGGAFTNGSGDVPALRGANLARAADAVVVTVNYRLGPLGFAWHPELRAPANLGLLDQRAAVAWVAENIAAFGGDPRRVTLGGDSAGAMAAALHARGPDGGGAFAQLTLHSGVPTLLDPEETADRTAQLAARLGGTVDDLHGAPAADLVRATTSLGPNGRFGPTVGQDWPGEPAAVGRPRPTIVNTTADEGSFLLVEQDAPPRTCDPEVVDKLTRQLFTEPADRWADRAAHAGSPVWRTVYDRPSTLWHGWLGATHTLDVPVLFGTHRHPALARLYAGDPGIDAVSRDRQRTWAAFLHDGAPTSAEGSPWPRWPARLTTNWR